MATFLRQTILDWYGHMRISEEYNQSRKMMGMVYRGREEGAA